MYCEYLKSIGNEDEIESFLPDISQFVSILLASIEDEFIMKQLLLIVNLLDLSDESRRKQFCNVITKFLPDPSVSNELRRILMATLRYCSPEENDYIRICLEVISEVQDPMVESRQSSQDEKKISASPNAKQPKADLENKDMWLRCTTITEELLKHTKHVIEKKKN